MRTDQTIVVLTGLGSLAPFIAFTAEVLRWSLLATVCKAAFSVTWIFMLAHILLQKNMEGSSKVGWFLGLFFFGFLIAPFYWYYQIRDAQKWSRLGRTW